MALHDKTLQYNTVEYKCNTNTNTRTNANATTNANGRTHTKKQIHLQLIATPYKYTTTQYNIAYTRKSSRNADANCICNKVASNAIQHTTH